MKWRLDRGQIEVLDDALAEVIRRKTPAERIAMLARWKERGIIDHISEGVVRLIQSEAAKPDMAEADEFIISYIPESLIMEIVVFQPVPPPSSVQAIMPAQALNGES